LSTTDIVLHGKSAISAHFPSRSASQKSTCCCSTVCLDRCASVGGLGFSAETACVAPSHLGAMTYSARFVLDACTLVVPAVRAFLQAFAPSGSCLHPSRNRATGAAYRMVLHGLYGAAGRQPGPHLVGARLPGVGDLLVQVLRHLQLSRDGHSGKAGCDRRLVGGHRRHSATPRQLPACFYCLYSDCCCLSSRKKQ